MSGVQQSDALKNLVIFMIALAILGTIIALAWYFVVDLPLQQAVLHAPVNSCRPGSPGCEPQLPHP
jgi:hypothetical protein